MSKDGFTENEMAALLYSRQFKSMSSSKSSARNHGDFPRHGDQSRRKESKRTFSRSRSRSPVRFAPTSKSATSPHRPSYSPYRGNGDNDPQLTDRPAGRSTIVNSHSRSRSRSRDVDRVRQRSSSRDRYPDYRSERGRTRDHDRKIDDDYHWRRSTSDSAAESLKWIHDRHTVDEPE